MTALETIELIRYDEALPADTAARATRELEKGNVLFFPRLAFMPGDGEERLLAPEWADGKSKKDALKRDEAYQRSAARVRVEFPAGSTWMLFSACVLYAALAGRHALEQTFLVPVGAILDPRRSPMLALEAMYGRKLA